MNPRREVNRVLLITLGFNLAVALGKIITGLVIGALSITADGFHSLADGASNIVALVANTVAGKAPDSDHPYGHQRFETLAAMGIGILLLVTAWETTRGIIERLSGGEPPNLNPPAFIVMIITLVINIGVNRYQVWHGKRLNSELLLADAANTGADVFVTLSVLIGMGLMLILEWYWVDIAAALIVVLLIGRAAWKILQRTGSVLVDTAPFSPEQLTALVMQIPAVTGVIRARSRGAANNAIIDLDVQIAPETTAERSAVVAETIQNRLQMNFGEATEVNVQFTPVEPQTRDYRTITQITAEALGLGAHHVYMNQGERGDVLELHVEVPAGQTLDDAHEQVSQLEKELQRRLPEVIEVVTHLEPAEATSGNCDVPFRSVREVESNALNLLKTRYPEIGWHNLQVYEQPRGLGITLHAAVDSTISIEEAHDLAAEAERLLRAQIHGLDRITIHTEP